MNTITPYINFNGNCAEAFDFYHKILGGDLQVSRYNELEDQMGLSGDDLKLVANAAIIKDGVTALYGSDAPIAYRQPDIERNGFSVNLETNTAEEASRYFDYLSQDGKVIMPFGETEWAESFAMFTDKFGIEWMILYIGTKRN